MSLINSLFAGVSGLKNHQSMLDVIGNNIANVNSIGFKGSRITFSDTFNQFVRYGTNPSEGSGGTNTYQIGLGMKVNSIDRNWAQGTFERTGVLTDLALQGDGLFILKSNGETFYSRAGAFMFDANGKLVNPQNGAIVQGKVATEDGVVPPGNNLQDVIIDPNLRLPAVATTNINWGGNLSSNSFITRSEEYIQSGNINSALAIGDTTTDANTIYDESGREYSFSVTYTKTAADTYDIAYTLTDKSNPGAPILTGGPVTAVFDPATGDMLTMNGAAPAAIQIQDTTLGINFNFDPTTVTQTNNTTTLSSTVDANRAVNVVTGTVTIFDSLGASHTLSIKFTKTSANNWNWSASIPSSSGGLSNNSGTISFNPDGSVNTISPNPPVLSYTPAGGASSQNIELNFGSSFGGITQTSANPVVSALNQNGSASAFLSNLSIDQYGYIVGIFSNGASRNLAQILVATFPNLNGLSSIGDNLYTVSANSGAPFIGDPGESTQTTIQSGALEQSNVDLSEEFTRMIVSQRGFQANARVITVSDSLLQEITNLVR
ncbi:MAG TPA: flagellar hook protein FlgE [Ignavibacteriaceae bacterium]|jgi:flagellar hook protein FlgE|nr:flagellar hook protein FlgE [Ignavibacteriaceae bacterium]